MGISVEEALCHHRDPEALVEDPGSPYLLVDLYKGDEGFKPPWKVLPDMKIGDGTTGAFIGAIIKATQGIHYNDNGWFKYNWQAIFDAAPERYGTSWFRGAYCFLDFRYGGKEQAQFYLQRVDEAGGWDDGSILPIVDVELGAERNPNQKASATRVIEVTTAWAAEVKRATGRRSMLYGRGAMRDLKIRTKMGCSAVWNPSYTERMVTNGLLMVDGKLGPWELEDIVLWQYTDGETEKAARLPGLVPGFGDGKVDLSVVVEGIKRPTLRSFIERAVR